MPLEGVRRTECVDADEPVGVVSYDIAATAHHGSAGAGEGSD
jgi:hypothetical protein